MAQHSRDGLWGEFPKTATEFERFAVKDLECVMGFDTYKTAWTSLRKLRAALVRPEREPLGPFVQMDEALEGERRPARTWCWCPQRATGACAWPTPRPTFRPHSSGSPNGQLPAEADRLANSDSDCLAEWPCERVVQTEAKPRESDSLHVCHWTISGTHAAAANPKRPQAYLDEHAFHHDRRKTNGVGCIAARVITSSSRASLLTMRSVIDDQRCNSFRSPHAALT